MKRLATTASAALFVAITAVATSCGGNSSSDSGAAPAFSPGELSSMPAANWITNGGSVSNQRYSPLTQINTRNVTRLKGLWHVHLRSGSLGKYSGEAQPLVYKNVIYVVTGGRRFRDRRAHRRDEVVVPRAPGSEDPLALPGGPPRHLGLRRPQPGRPVHRLRRRSRAPRRRPPSPRAAGERDPAHRARNTARRSRVDRTSAEAARRLTRLPRKDPAVRFHQGGGLGPRRLCAVDSHEFEAVRGGRQIAHEMPQIDAAFSA
jgi:hypothetical protein